MNFEKDFKDIFDRLTRMQSMKNIDLIQNQIDDVIEDILELKDKVNGTIHK